MAIEVVKKVEKLVYRCLECPMCQGTGYISAGDEDVDGCTYCDRDWGQVKR